MTEEESMKLLLEAGKETPHLKVDNELPEYREFIKERKFKLIPFTHPENFQTTYYCVHLDGFNYATDLLPGHVWMTQVHEVFDDDIITASFPKTGSTWIQEIVWIISNNFDFDKSATVDLSLRAPFLDISGIARPALQAQNRPRQYHIHAPYPHLPPAIREKKLKIIYVMRNPKDTCVSYYHLIRFVEGSKYSGDFKEFARMFMNNEVMWGPYDKHVLSFWEHRHEGHILIVTYEEMKKDLRGIIRKIATFLNKTVSEEQVEMLAEHASFKTMAQSKTTNREDFFDETGIKDKQSSQKFMRKGIIGDWRNHLDEETNQKFDKWIQEKFGTTGPTFVYE